MKLATLLVATGLALTWACLPPSRPKPMTTEQEDAAHAARSQAKVARINAMSCDDIDRNYSDNIESVEKDRASTCRQANRPYDCNERYNDKYYVAVGRRLIQCKRWKRLFEDDLQVYPETILTLGEDHDVPLDDAVEAYLSQPSPFAGAAYATYSATNITRWMIEQRPPDYCHKVAKWTPNFSGSWTAPFINYFGQTRCTDALAFLLQSLRSDDSSVRQAACTALGNLGDPRALHDLNVIASSDPAHNEEPATEPSTTPIYFVRDACAAAAGRLQLSLQPR